MGITFLTPLAGASRSRPGHHPRRSSRRGAQNPRSAAALLPRAPGPPRPPRRAGSRRSPPRARCGRRRAASRHPSPVGDPARRRAGASSSSTMSQSMTARPSLAAPSRFRLAEQDVVARRPTLRRHPARNRDDDRHRVLPNVMPTTNDALIRSRSPNRSGSPSRLVRCLHPGVATSPAGSPARLRIPTSSLFSQAPDPHHLHGRGVAPPPPHPPPSPARLPPRLSSCTSGRPNSQRPT